MSDLVGNPKDRFSHNEAHIQIMLGKCKTLTQQSGAEGENIEPTPNYDCHVSQVQARPSDSLYLQLARSQVTKPMHDEWTFPLLAFGRVHFQFRGIRGNVSSKGIGLQTCTCT